mgnify:CR=1 FL=1
MTLSDDATIQLGHGGGGRLSQQLIHELLLPAFGPADGVLHDAALLPPQSGRLAFTTDSFVVRPLLFPGGDIGHLAVCGSVNDLAMAGATPLALSLALILEEGLPVATLRQVIHSIRSCAASWWRRRIGSCIAVSACMATRRRQVCAAAPCWWWTTASPQA